MRHFLRIVLVAVTLVIAVAGCSGIRTTDDPFVLPYNSFGPQVAAHRLIGFEWFQWNSSGSSDPNNVEPIFVVVSTKSLMEEAKKRYVVSEQEQSDYRFVTVDAALKYIDDELADADARLLFGKTLQSTRSKIEQHFGDRR